ncbi:MAG: alpha/beta hydrolase [Rhodospirillaceae bacterium]|nr:alpha/beta hydrolase [Rhodospirillaceae bacterium]
MPKQSSPFVQTYRPPTRRQALGAVVTSGFAAVSPVQAQTNLASLYRSATGKAAVMALYERKLLSLPFRHESRWVSTQFGQTHVLCAGVPHGPPVVLIHGVNFAAPFMADFVRPLMDHFRVFVPDIAGQPGRSSETQPTPVDHHYAGWLADVLDGLALDAASFLGVSFGGAVILDLAAAMPARFSKAVLIVPGGFAVAGSPLALFLRLLLPWQLYRVFPDRERIADVVRPLAWELDDDHYDFFDALLRHVRWLIPPPGPFAAVDLKDFRAPTALYAAREDIFFPGDELERVARSTISNLAETIVYDSSHYPTKAMLADVTVRMARFLKTA